MKGVTAAVAIGLVSIAATIYAGCYSYPDTKSRDGSTCNGGGGNRLLTWYTPTSWQECSFTANPLSGCGSRTQPAEKRVMQMSNPGCNPPIAGDSGWIPDGTKPNDYSFKCCIKI
jgi:hypothetical protein